MLVLVTKPIWFLDILKQPDGHNSKECKCVSTLRDLALVLWEPTCWKAWWEMIRVTEDTVPHSHKHTQTIDAGEKATRGLCHTQNVLFGAVINSQQKGQKPPVTQDWKTVKRIKGPRLSQVLGWLIEIDGFGLSEKRVNCRRVNQWIRNMTWNMVSEPVIASAWLFSGWEPLWSACCCCCQLATIITGLEVTVISLLSPDALCTPFRSSGSASQTWADENVENQRGKLD